MEGITKFVNVALVDDEVTYVIAKVILNLELSSKLAKLRSYYQRAEEVRQESELAVAASNASATPSALNYSLLQQWFGGPRISQHEISNYWEEKGQQTSERAQRAVLVLQIAFRLWLALSKLRRTRNIGGGIEENLQHSLMLIQRWQAIRSTAKLVHESEERDGKLKEFCLEMTSSDPENMFRAWVYSKKYGQKYLRYIRFCSKFKNLIVTTSSHLIAYKTIPLDSIYGIIKGMSPAHYPLAETSAEDKKVCMHLQIKGGAVLDLHTRKEDPLEFEKFFDNMSILISVLTGRASYYIDSNGFARKASSSIIRYMVEDIAQNCRSEADRYRFEDALRQLQNDYKVSSQLYRVELGYSGGPILYESFKNSRIPGIDSADMIHVDNFINGTSAELSDDSDSNSESESGSDEDDGAEHDSEESDSEEDDSDEGSEESSEEEEDDESDISGSDIGEDETEEEDEDDDECSDGSCTG